MQDPIAFAWGPDGKLWVVEMGDYPLGVDGKGKPGGRVKFLERTKGDGNYDKATVFLDDLGFPTGVLPWRKGVLVTCAPDIFYAEDTDGDGKADKKQVLFTGFNEGNQQHRVNGLVWGLDNWIYVRQRRQRRHDQVAEDRRRRSTSAAAISHPARHRRTSKPCSGPDAVRPQPRRLGQLVRRQQQQPDVPLRPRRPLPAPQPARRRARPRVPVSVTPGVAPVYPVSRTLPRFNDPGAANHFTSACSPIVYRDDLFGPAFANNTFVSEPVHNLVHREIMSRPGRHLHAAERAADEQTKRVPGVHRQLVPADDDRTPAPTAACGSPTCTGP